MDKEGAMSCQIILMDQNNNHMFEVDEVIDVVPTGVNLGSKVYNNPKFKIIQSDMPMEEAKILLESERNIMGDVVHLRLHNLLTRDIEEKETSLNRDEVLSRVETKESETYEQTEDIIIG